MKRTLLIVAAVLIVGVAAAVALSSAGAPSPGLIDSAQLKKLQSQGARIVDVRTAAEYAGGHIAGSENVPMSDLDAAIGSWDPKTPIVLYCATGSRSAEAAQALRSAGFEKVYDLADGIVAWNGELAGGAGTAAVAAQPSASGLPVMYEFYTDW